MNLTHLFVDYVAYKQRVQRYNDECLEYQTYINEAADKNPLLIKRAHIPVTPLTYREYHDTVFWAFGMGHAK